MDWPVGLIPAYCFEPHGPMLRARIQIGTLQAIFNKLGSFQDRYIGLDVTLFRDGKRCGQIKVDKLETLPKVEESLFQAPSDGVTQKTDNVALAPAVMAGYKLYGAHPTYPLEAKHNHVQGTVVLQVRIGRDGHIRNLRPVSGPPELYATSLSAVQGWVYKPYLLNGAPVELTTTVNVVYHLGN